METNATICPIALSELLQNEVAYPENDGLAAADLNAFNEMTADVSDHSSVPAQTTIDKLNWGTAEEWGMIGQLYGSITVPISAKRHALYLGTVTKIEHATLSEDKTDDEKLGSLSRDAVELSRLMHCDAEVVPEFIRKFALESYDDLIEDTKILVQRGYFRQATVNLNSMQDDIEYLGLEADLPTILDEMDRLIDKSDLYPSKRKAQKEWVEMTQVFRK